MNHSVIESTVIDTRPSIRLQKREAFSSFILLGATALGGVLGFKYSLSPEVNSFIAIPAGVALGAVSGFVSGPILANAKEAVTDKIEFTISQLRDKFHNSENTSKLDLK